MQMTIRSWLPLIAAAALCALALSWRAGAGASIASAPQTSVAVVDVQQLFKNLDEYRSRDSQIQEQRGELQREFDQKLEALRLLRDELNELPTGSDARLRKVMEGLRLEATINAEGEAWQGWLVMEQSRLVKEMFRKAEEAVQSVASRDGWDVVLWDHSTNPSLTLDGQAAESFETMNRRLVSRTIAYSSPRADITQLVIDTMNNAYAAGQ